MTRTELRYACTMAAATIAFGFSAFALGLVLGGFRW